MDEVHQPINISIDMVHLPNYVLWGLDHCDQVSLWLVTKSLYSEDISNPFCNLGTIKKYFDSTQATLESENSFEDIYCELFSAKVAVDIVFGDAS
jgi:hypothetical protein